VVRENDGSLYVVMQLAGENLHNALQKVDRVDEATCAEIMRGLLQGLAALHRLNFVHRDVKPENILIARSPDSTTGLVVTIGDLGSACEHTSVLNECYVTTRFYRAPEMVLDQPYGAAVDVWAAGCVGFEAVEFLSILARRPNPSRFKKLAGRPLFPAHNEADLLVKFCALLGSPPDYLMTGTQARDSLSSQQQQQQQHESADRDTRVPRGMPRRPFRLAFAHTKHSAPSQACVDLFEALLQWEAIDRPSCHQALRTSRFLMQSL